jgi:hypothetical protein
MRGLKGFQLLGLSLLGPVDKPLTGPFATRVPT